MKRCRLCYSKKHPAFQRDMLDEKTSPVIVEAVKILTNIEITKDDPYSKWVCLDCYSFLVIIYEYRNAILNTNKLFKNEGNYKNLGLSQKFHASWFYIRTMYIFREDAECNYMPRSATPSEVSLEPAEINDAIILPGEKEDANEQNGKKISSSIYDQISVSTPTREHFEKRDYIIYKPKNQQQVDFESEKMDIEEQNITIIDLTEEEHTGILSKNIDHNKEKNMDIEEQNIPIIDLTEEEHTGISSKNIDRNKEKKNSNKIVDQQPISSEMNNNSDNKTDVEVRNSEKKNDQIPDESEKNMDVEEDDSEDSDSFTISEHSNISMSPSDVEWLEQAIEGFRRQLAKKNNNQILDKSEKKMDVEKHNSEKDDDRSIIIMSPSEIEAAERAVEEHNRQQEALAKENNDQILDKSEKKMDVEEHDFEKDDDSINEHSYISMTPSDIELVDRLVEDYNRHQEALAKENNDQILDKSEKEMDVEEHDSEEDDDRSTIIMSPSEIEAAERAVEEYNRQQEALARENNYQILDKSEKKTVVEEHDFEKDYINSDTLSTIIMTPSELEEAERFVEEYNRKQEALAKKNNDQILDKSEKKMNAEEHDSEKQTKDAEILLTNNENNVNDQGASPKVKILEQIILNAGYSGSGDFKSPFVATCNLTQAIDKGNTSNGNGTTKKNGRKTKATNNKKPKAFYQCSICDRKFRLEKTLNKHLEIHAGQCHYQCYICGKMFSYKKNFQRHIENHLMNGNQCKYCSLKLVLISDFEKHLLTHIDANSK